MKDLECVYQEPKSVQTWYSTQALCLAALQVVVTQVLDVELHSAYNLLSLVNFRTPFHYPLDLHLYSGCDDW
jgi:hypothetical protein